jgi:hypothetical protein
LRDEAISTLSTPRPEIASRRAKPAGRNDIVTQRALRILKEEHIRLFFWSSQMTN